MALTISTAVTPSVARVVLRPQKAQPFFGRHPWVLASAVDRVEPLSLAGEHFLDLDGQPVDLVTDKGKFIARGLYNSKSRIRVRLFTWVADEALDEAFFRRRIEAAIRMRREIGYEASGETDARRIDAAHGSPFGISRSEMPTASRLIFSEADGLSGLVVDRYGDYLVVQITSLAIAQRVEMIVAILQDLLQPRGIVLRSEKSMGQLEGVELATGAVWGTLPDGAIEIAEHGLVYQVDLHEGQKTGFYLDQRENRLAAAKYLEGRRVLDMFCYTGGFAMCAAAIGGAKEVLGIDGSKKAIAQARQNAERNRLTNVKFDVGDGFQTLASLAGQQERFDAVILDPPKFARTRSGVNQALMAYHRLNRLAVELLPPGGVLITCSCSGGVRREDFELMLSCVAQKTGRDLQILEARGAAPDHPVSATCLETEYLKCLICRVN